MEVKELGHIVLYAHDIGASTHFYRDVFGWSPIHQGPDEIPSSPVMAFNAPNGRTHHELLLIEVGASASPIPGGRRVGLYHFGLKIGESDDELREALAAPRANDVNIMSSTDHGMTHSIYITDPDGNEIELHIDVPDVDWSDRTLWTTYRHKALRLLPKFAIRFASRVGSC